MTTSAVSYSKKITALQIAQIVQIRNVLLAADFEVEYLASFETEFTKKNHHLAIVNLTSAIQWAFKNDMTETAFYLKYSILLLNTQIDNITGLSFSPGYNLYHLFKNQIATLNLILSSILAPIIITSP